MSRTATYALIASQTLGSATSTVTFSSIPNTYTDLLLVFQGVYSLTAGSGIRLNSDSASNYSQTWIYGDGATAGSFRLANSSLVGTYNVTSAQVLNTFHILDYSNTTTYKTILLRNNLLGVDTEAAIATWRNTNAVNTVTASLDRAGNFNTGSTFRLYGIEAGNA